MARERQIHEMSEMLRGAGAANPAARARRLYADGVRPSELAFRLSVGERGERRDPASRGASPRRRRPAVRVAPRYRAQVSRRVRELVAEGYSPRYAARRAYRGQDPRKLTAAQRRRIPARLYALPARRALPIEDRTHVRNAASRLEQMHRRGTVTESEYRSARAKIASRERQLGIHGAYVGGRDPVSRRSRRYPPYPRGKSKIERVLHEFKTGKLKTRGGRRVTSHKQAVAIALAEQRRAEGLRSRDPDKAGNKLWKYREVGPTGAVMWHGIANTNYVVFWNGPGSRLRIGTPRGSLTFIDHPMASDSYETMKQAEAAIRRLYRVTA